MYNIRELLDISVAEKNTKLMSFLMQVIQDEEKQHISHIEYEIYLLYAAHELDLINSSSFYYRKLKLLELLYVKYI